MRVILASSSPYRQALLRQIRLPFIVEKPRVDEGPMQKEPLLPSEVARRLAELKGQDVADRWPEDLVIAGDQVAHFRGRILPKPGTDEGAFNQLKVLSGQTHTLSTALWVRHPQMGVQTHLDETHIELHALSDEEIISYLEVDTPFDCAGAYKIESAGMALVKSLKSDDQSAIVGLPLIALGRIFRDWRMPIAFTWDRKKENP